MFLLSKQEIDNEDGPERDMIFHKIGQGGGIKFYITWSLHRCMVLVQFCVLFVVNDEDRIWSVFLKLIWTKVLLDSKPQEFVNARGQS